MTEEGKTTAAEPEPTADQAAGTAAEPKQEAEPELKPEQTAGRKPPADAEAKPEPSDRHGEPGINREKYARDIAERDARIAELEKRLEQAAATEKGREELRAEIDKLRAEQADKDLTYELRLAGCRDPKMAKAVLADYGGDVAKLKQAAPWLFEQEKKGATGLRPEGAPSDADERVRKAREAAGTQRYYKER